MVKPENISQDASLSSRFRDNGYFTVPFLTPEEAGDLLDQLYRLQSPTRSSPIYHSYIHNDTASAIPVHQLISGFVTPLLSRLNLSLPLRILTAVFIDKSPSADSVFQLHTDDSLCDERIFTQINIWIPLTDVTFENGTMCICNHSHFSTPLIRADSSDDTFIKNNRESLLGDYSAMHMAAGQALVYNPACIHFSPPNKSTKNRPVVACVLAPENANLCVFIRNKRLIRRDQLLKYDLTFEQFANKTPLKKITPTETILL